ncbi:MAG: ABC transporter substrate-binding protein [Phycisphaerae bacterium]|nr:ABC transporter substrate-binding protein [Phycisphaerae bacterium]
MLLRAAIIITLVLIILGVPFALRPKQFEFDTEPLTLTALSPHNEAIRYEYQVAFSKWHEKHYGKPVLIDWRSIGGTSMIAQYLASEYVAAFRAHWTGRLGKRWSPAVEEGFANRRIDPDKPAPDVPPDAVQARRVFLESEVGIGVDLFFGGGWYDHDKQAQIGNTVACGIATEHPELLRNEIMPRVDSGEIYYDKLDRYYGCCLTCFGICYNHDVLKRLGIPRPPSQWTDLADPRFFGEIGLADPSKSGSANKAFEMLIQQQIIRRIHERQAGKSTSRHGDTKNPSTGPAGAAKLTETEEKVAVAEGFWAGMRLIQLIAANARYFTNTASKVPIDVVQGNSGAGMCIDFYGRFEAGMAEQREGSDRMGYVTPIGGSSVSADPVSMLRGAPHRELAKRFITFCLSIEGQQIWDYRVGTPGGPVKYALRRPPIRRDMYTPEHRRYFADPDVDPYKLADAFTYNYRWTASLFDFIRLFVRTMCIDTHNELTAAWSAVIAAGGPDACPAILVRMQAMPLTYEQATKLNLRDKLEAVELARQWDAFFRGNYEAARELAEEVRGGRATR